MAKYLMTFNVVEMLQKLVPDGYFEVSGFDKLEVYVTVPADLTATQLSAITQKLPFVHVTKV